MQGICMEVYGYVCFRKMEFIIVFIPAYRTTIEMDRIH